MKKVEKFKKEAALMLNQTIEMMDKRILFDYNDLVELLEIDLVYLKNFWDKLEKEEMEEMEKL